MMQQHSTKPFPNTTIRRKQQPQRADTAGATTSLSHRNQQLPTVRQKTENALFTKNKLGRAPTQGKHRKLIVKKKRGFKGF